MSGILQSSIEEEREWCVELGYIWSSFSLRYWRDYWRNHWGRIYSKRAVWKLIISNRTNDIMISHFRVLNSCREQENENLWLFREYLENEFLSRFLMPKIPDSYYLLDSTCNRKSPFRVSQKSTLISPMTSRPRIIVHDRDIRFGVTTKSRYGGGNAISETTMIEQSRFRPTRHKQYQTAVDWPLTVSSAIFPRSDKTVNILPLDDSFGFVSKKPML